MKENHKKKIKKHLEVEPTSDHYSIDDSLKRILLGRSLLYYTVGCPQSPKEMRHIIYLNASDAFKDYMNSDKDNHFGELYKKENIKRIINKYLIKVNWKLSSLNVKLVSYEEFERFLEYKKEHPCTSDRFFTDE